MKLAFSRKILEKYKNIQISNVTKIRPAEVELLHTEGRPDVTTLIVAFYNFAKEPEIYNEKRKDQIIEPLNPRVVQTFNMSSLLV
jgi:hypothetical protein